MPNLIQVKRGELADVETLQNGEFGFTTDTYQLYIGNTVGINQEIVMHHQLEVYYDGDVLDITWVPTYYTPKSVPIEALDSGDLTAHLYGIDQKLAPIADLETTVLYDDSSGDFYLESTDGDMHFRANVMHDSSGDSSSGYWPEDGLTIVANGGVELYYNGYLRLATTTAGVTMTGIMTMTEFAVTPSSAPTSNYQVANKKYVDDAAGAGGSSYAVYVEDGGSAIDDSASETMTLNFDGSEFEVVSESNGEVSIAIGIIDGGSF